MLNGIPSSEELRRRAAPEDAAALVCRTGGEDVGKGENTNEGKFAEKPRRGRAVGSADDSVRSGQLGDFLTSSCSSDPEDPSL